MRHGNSMTMFATDFWMVIAITIVIVTMFAGIIWMIHRKKIASDGLTPMERKSLDYPENEILSMLRQHGSSIMQNEMADVLPVDMDELVEALTSLESKKLIFRKWRADQKTYLISAKQNDMENNYAQT